MVVRGWGFVVTVAEAIGVKYAFNMDRKTQALGLKRLTGDMARYPRFAQRETAEQRKMALLQSSRGGFAGSQSQCRSKTRWNRPRRRKTCLSRC